MNTSADISNGGPSDRWLNRWGLSFLWTAFGFGILLIAISAWKADWVLPFVPIVLIGGAAALALFRRPLVNLAVVMCGFVLIVGFEAGVQPSEILYGLYYMGFLAHWFVTRSLLQRQQLCTRPEERVLLIFLVLITLSIPVSVLFNGWPSMIMGEWMSLSLLAFYWPIREAVANHKNGLKVVVGAVIFIGIFVLARNLLEFRNDLVSANQLWQIGASRAVTNESLLMVPALFSLAAFLYVRSLKAKLFYLCIVLIMFAGLILTHSRAYWVAFFIGAGLLFIFVSAKDKLRLLTAGVVSAAGLFLLAYVVLGDFLLLVFTGLLDRLLSLQTAVTKDVSLINRFLEIKGVWPHIKHNPVLGHGMGVPYRFYNITYNYSEVKTFIHNGYVALFFKFGIWGLGMMLFMMARFPFRALQFWRSRKEDYLPRLISLSVAGSLIALAVTATTSNPFYQNDLMFVYAVLWGIAGGCYSGRKHLIGLNFEAPHSGDIVPRTDEY